MRKPFGNGMEGASGGADDDAMRRAAKPPQQKRFYKTVGVAEAGAGLAITLDGRPIKTPALRELAAPARTIADAVVREWEAQGEAIDPQTMPMTRLANAIVDGVASRTAEVAADIAKYFESDLLFYRAEGPAGLLARQAAHWDPILDWATEVIGARFILSQGVTYVTQPSSALHAARQALPTEPWSVGALHSVTTLTGSALLAVALARGFRAREAVWAAAHVDEDWNMEQWGRDEMALARRTARKAEFDAAALVLEAMAAP